MKKIAPNRFSEVIPVVALYESDLNEITETIHQRANAQVVFQYRDAEFESVEDLRTHLGEFLRTLEINASINDKEHYEYGRLSVNFTDRFVILSADSNFELQYRRISELLSSRRRVSGRVPDLLWISLGVSLWLLLLAAPNIISAIYHLSALPKVVLYVVCLGGAIALSTGRIKIRRNLLILRKRHEHQTFLKRHEENIVRGVIAVISAAVGTIVGYLLKK